MEQWQQSINWHLNKYEETGSLYHLAAALTEFKKNMPKYYEQWKNEIIKKIGKPEPIRVKMND